jgi:hypothetical protein
VIELHGPVHDAHRRGAINGLKLHKCVVCKRLLVLGKAQEPLRGAPPTLHRPEVLAPVIEGFFAIASVMIAAAAGTKTNGVTSSTRTPFITCFMPVPI